MNNIFAQLPISENAIWEQAREILQQYKGASISIEGAKHSITDAIIKCDGNKKLMEAFWSLLSETRIWIGVPEGGKGEGIKPIKKRGWTYIDAPEIHGNGILNKAELIVINYLGPNTSKRSMRVDSVLGLVKSIRQVSKANIFVKARISDKDLWKDIVSAIKGEDTVIPAPLGKI